MSHSRYSSLLIFSYQLSNRAGSRIFDKHNVTHCVCRKYALCSQCQCHIVTLTLWTQCVIVTLTMSLCSWHVHDMIVHCTIYMYNKYSEYDTLTCHWSLSFNIVASTHDLYPHLLYPHAAWAMHIRWWHHKILINTSVINTSTHSINADWPFTGYSTVSITMTL